MKPEPSFTILPAPNQSEGAHHPAPTSSPTSETSPAPERPAARRHGDIAHLPKETRDMINLMLDDGLPYHILIEELGEAGQGLKPKNLTDWVQGRYQDYLKNREDIEHTKTQIEFATDLIRELGETGPGLIYNACSKVAALQIFKAIKEYGDEALRKMLHLNPASYLTMINTLCNMTNSILKAEGQRLADERAARNNPAVLIPANVPKVKPN